MSFAKAFARVGYALIQRSLSDLIVTAPCTIIAPTFKGKYGAHGADSGLNRYLCLSNPVFHLARRESNSAAAWLINLKDRGRCGGVSSNSRQNDFVRSIHFCLGNGH